MKNLKLENIIFDLKKNYWKLLLLLFGLLFVFEALGVFELKNSAIPSSEEQKEVVLYQEKMEEYERVLDSYDQRINERSIALEKQRQMLVELTAYAESAPYMKLEPSCVKSASVDIAIVCAEGVDTGAVFQELLVYFNNGYYVKDLLAKGEEENLSELFTAVQTETGINLNLLHYDTERANQLLQQIVGGFLQYAEELKEHRSGFEVQPGEIILTEGENTTVLDKQNSVRSNIESYQASCNSLEETINNLKAEQEKYREENKPEPVQHETLNIKKTLLFHGIAAVLMTVLLFLFIEIIRYIFNSFIYTEEDLLEAGITPLCCENKGVLCPETERAVMDIELRLKGEKKLGICVFNQGLEMEQERLTELEKALNKQGIQTNLLQFGNHSEFESYLVKNDACIIIVEKRRTAVKEIEELLLFCRKFQIPVLGGALLE